MKKYLLWMLTVILTCGLVLTSCSNDDDPIPPADEVEAQLQQMTLREKVGQLFYIRQESLDPSMQYTSAEAAVSSIKAGVDIVLGPRYFIEAFDAVIAAVNNGTLSEERINQSVRRILKLRNEIKRPASE